MPSYTTNSTKYPETGERQPQEGLVNQVTLIRRLVYRWPAPEPPVAVTDGSTLSTVEITANRLRVLSRKSDPATRRP